MPINLSLKMNPSCHTLPKVLGSHRNDAKLTWNILNKKLNKFRCNFTIECSEQPLKRPVSARHCSILTGLILYNEQLSYMNPMQ